MSEYHANLRRAELLLDQHRFDAAEEHLRRALIERPEDGHPHALLALCMLEREDFRGATAEAEQAIGLEPDVAYFHYVRAIVSYQRNMPAEAMSSIDEAIRLEPSDPDNWGVRASLLLAKKKHADALESAERGLAEDPDHVMCANVRAQSLVGLGRRDEAGQTIDSVLRRDPENARTHANMGWTQLHKGDPKAAMSSFREALRLEPGLDWARAGIVEAMKARFFIYRIFLAYLLWMSRLSDRTQWLILIGGYVVFRVARAYSKSHPELQPVLVPIVVLYLAFAALTVLGYPFFNLLLCLNRFGRFALTPTDRLYAYALGVAMLAAASAAIAWATIGGPFLRDLTVVLGFFVVPVAITGVVRDDQRKLMLAYTGAVALVGVMLLVAPFDGVGFVYGLASIGSIWVVNLLGTSREKVRE